MPTPTDGNRELLTVIAFVRAPRGKREELKAALDALIEPVKREDGYVNYDLRQAVEDPDFFTYLEAGAIVTIARGRMRIRALPIVPAD